MRHSVPWIQRWGATAATSTAIATAAATGSTATLATTGSTTARITAATAASTDATAGLTQVQGSNVDEQTKTPWIISKKMKHGSSREKILQIYGKDVLSAQDKFWSALKAQENSDNPHGTSFSSKTIPQLSTTNLATSGIHQRTLG